MTDPYVWRDGHNRLAFWQRRCFDHNCRNEDALWNKVRYCHMNPVTRGLVRIPGDYPWSSYRWYYELGGVVLKLNVSREAL